MPPLETDCRFQQAVVQLASATSFDDYGNSKVAAAKQLDGGVRWEDVKREVTDPQGNNISIEADVVVGETISIGSIMWKGKLGSYISTVTKYRVMFASEIPDLKGRNIRRTVSLMKWNDTAPSTA